MWKVVKWVFGKGRYELARYDAKGHFCFWIVGETNMVTFSTEQDANRVAECLRAHSRQSGGKQPKFLVEKISD